VDARRVAARDGGDLSVAAARRALCPPGAAPGQRLVLDAEESHHVLKVLRLRPGDPLAVFDGYGREWSAALEATARGAAVVRVGLETRTPVEAGLPVEIAQALSRPDRMEWAIQKVTEVGAAAVHVWRARRSEGADPDAERLARWERIAREACKQCGRRRVPRIGFAPGLPPPPGPDTLGLVLDAGAGAPGLLQRLTGPAPGRVRVVVGPEGGFETGEIAALEAAGYRRASLGPRTLRTETAGVVAGAVVLLVWDVLDPGAAGS
jgi:16S rRNA (uracil1498-N3)-methyltransferase